MMEGLDSLKISEEKKKYIVDVLNPVLEEMVAECIRRMPADPAPFMLQWLEEKAGSKKGAGKSAAEAEEEEEEEEEDDADDEPPPDFEKPQATKARASVSAEAYGEWNTKKAFVAPVIAKTDEQTERLRAVLGKSFLFSNLEDNEFAVIIGAMKEVHVAEHERVIQQGDSGDFLCVIESGDFDCIIKSAEDGTEKVVKTCGPGDVFGELALLYNCPRAATVQSRGGSICWQLDRDTFNHIVKAAAQKKRDRYDAFLSKVPLLAGMGAYERSQLADALQVEAFAGGATIVEEGEVGQKFYIIEEGKAVATKGCHIVMEYGVGDYFGELALITNQPRAATVQTSGPVKVLSLDSGSFKRLLNVTELAARAARYNT